MISIKLEDLKKLKDPENLKVQAGKIKELLKDKQIRIYLISGVLAVMAVLYLAFFLIPKFGDLARTSRTVGEFNDELNQITSRIKRQEAMKGKLKQLEAEYSGYTKRLPGQKEIPEFLEELASIAKTSRVKILSITPSELKAVDTGEKDGGYYREMPIPITAKSGYHQFGRFVSDLEKGSRFITISGLQIRYDSAFPRMHNVRMELKTYVSVDEETEEEKSESK